MNISEEAKEIITTLDLIAAHRAHIARRQEDPSPDTSKELNQARIEALQERVGELLAVLRKDGYVVRYRGTTTTVLKNGRKWLERMDWTEYTA